MTITTRFRRILSEISYADRRSFEIRTGVPVGARRSGTDRARQIAELDATFAQSPRVL